MSVRLNLKNKCTLNGDCIEVCPVGNLSLPEKEDKDERGMPLDVVKIGDGCIGCGACVGACSVEALILD